MDMEARMAGGSMAEPARGVAVTTAGTSDAELVLLLEKAAARLQESFPETADELLAAASGISARGGPIAEDR